MMDEAIVFEGDRRLRPLSMAVLIDWGSYYMMDAFAATRAPHGNRTEKTKRRIQEMEEAEGPRLDRHKTAIAKVIRTMVWNLVLAQPRFFFFFITDKEPTYEGVFNRVCRALPNTVARHIQEDGNLSPRDIFNPLFRINHTLALMRDRFGRFRRRSWLHSKKRKWLNLMLGMFLCHRNYVRPKKNDGLYTPGEMVDIPDGRLTHTQLLTWRQDWGGELSLRPSAKVA